MKNKVFKKIINITGIFIVCYCPLLSAQSVISPDHNIRATLSVMKGRPYYAVWYKNQPVIKQSALGIQTDDLRFFRKCRLINVSTQQLSKDVYQMRNAKKSHIQYIANKRIFHFKDEDAKLMNIIFQVSNDGVAFKYVFPGSEELHIEKELTSYQFDKQTTAWLQPKAEAKTGYEHTNPSYEEDYSQNIPVGTFSKTGWVYPALFNSSGNWVLITEAGMDGHYCGTSLRNEENSACYQVSFPDNREVIPGKGFLPKGAKSTPWRVMVIGSLKTIAESTLGTDLAIPQMHYPDLSFVQPGKASWSWIMSKDDSITYTETKRYIDFAHKMNWRYCLIDVDWDVKIGYDKVKELADYGATKNVSLLLWYNSAGDWNTVKYTPKDKLLTPESRDVEFKKLTAMGIKGIKVDFFGGDGQSMIQYYIDILNSAAKYHLLVNFHGATLPRGWARTYPQLMSTEAVRGFEMVTFSQQDADLEPTHAAMLPFTRNAFDPMDFTPMNLYNIETSSVTRKTTPGFELATSVLFLSGIQHYAESPSGMEHEPPFVIDYLRDLPNYWDEVRFIDGYPGKFVVLARKGGAKWYVTAINGQNGPKEITIDLSDFHAHTGKVITDGDDGQLIRKAVTGDSQDKIKLILKPKGGAVVGIDAEN